MPVLKFDCRFRYSSGFALDVSFEAMHGITALLGPSGAGKTTTLHLIAGILRPTEGCIELEGRTLFDSCKRINVPAEARRIGVVFQDYQLFPHLTVNDNLRYGLRRTPAKLDFDHLVDVFELGPLLRRFPGSLSGGQRQRVAIGRAIAFHPTMLLLDEPVSALDLTLKSTIVDFLARTLNEFQIPTLLVTHDTETAMRLNAVTIQLPLFASR